MLITIRNKGEKQPIFCIPGAPGNLGWLIDFALCMGKEYPVYGIEPEGLKNPDRIKMPISEMAAYNIKLLKSVQARGPYALLGYSYGGMVIYEMALQLAEQGEIVSHLIFLDAYAPGSKTIQTLVFPAFFPWLLLGNMFSTFWGASVLLASDDFFRISLEDYTGHVIDHWLRFSKTLLSKADLKNLLERSVELTKNSEVVVSSYKPKPYSYDTSVLLFKAEKGFICPSNPFCLTASYQTQYEDFHGWDRLFKSNILTYSIPSDHFELISSTHLKMIAEQCKLFKKSSSQSLAARS